MTESQRKGSRKGVLRVGLTGPMASGKSEVLRRFARLGVPVFSADDAVHRLYAPGGAAVEDIARLCPEARDERGGIDRKALASKVAEDPSLLSEIEAIVHPLVAEAREAFFKEAQATGIPYAVAEIPLLFETGGERDMDVTLAVVADEETCRRRALARPGMTEEKWAALTRRHLPAEEKAKRADIVIRNTGTLADLDAAVRRAHERLLALAAGEDAEGT